MYAMKPRFKLTTGLDFCSTNRSCSAWRREKIQKIVTLSLLHHSDANNPDPDVWNAMLNTTLWFTVYEVWSRIKEFWKDVLDTLSQIVSAKLPECPKLCFLDLFSATQRLYNTKKTIIVFSVLQAKHTNICLLGKT